MRYISLLFVTVFVTVCASSQVMAEEISSRDFAEGYYLELEPSGTVYSVLLPEEVYRTVKSAELKDVRVFNGAGEPVPHEFRVVKTDPTLLRTNEIVPIFPLFQEENTPDSSAGIALQVSRDTAGTIVNITSDGTKKDDRNVFGYLLDLSKLKQVASELELYWEKDIDSSVYTINIQQSDDLIYWTPLVHRATLADLQFAGQQVEKRNVTLPRVPLKYLQLTWQESRRPLKLQSVTSFSRIIDARKKHLWESLYNGIIEEDNEKLTINFDTDYRLPISSVQVRFPEKNSIARLSIQSRVDADGSYRNRCEQIFYDLDFEGSAIRNEPCNFGATADAQWRIVVKEDGAGLLSGNRKLTLQLGWEPNELIFIGRGTPPFLLAFGSGKIALQPTLPEAGILLQSLQKELAAQKVSEAKIGKKILLGGELALESPAKPTPWKKWFLWAVLVLGVGLLAFMARSLMKEMKTAEEKRVSEER